MNNKHLLRYIILGALVIVWLFLAFENRDIVINPAKKYLKKEYTFNLTKNYISKDYSDTLGKSYGLINFNGMLVRIIGGRECNKVVKLDNGNLTSVMEPYDASEHARNVKQLGERLKEKETDFLYVQAPYKMNSDLLPYGMEDASDDYIDAFLSELEGEVSYLDLRPYITDSSEHIMEYYYSTDHHWNPIGAFKGFQVISEYLQNEYPDEKICGIYQDFDNWEVHKKEKWFLGSWGKRTGKYYGGLDDLMWLTPTFEVEMSCDAIYENEFSYGDYYTANIRDNFIDTNMDFEMNSYYVYIGGDYPLVQQRNINAPVDKKILFIKDSFVLPLQTYFATVFSEIDTVDLRYYHAGTLYEYIEESKPDIVIMCINGGENMTKDIMFNFGVPEEDDKAVVDEKELYQIDSVSIESDPMNENNFVSVYDQIEAGKRYTVLCDSISVEEGKTDGITLKVSNGAVRADFDQTIWNLIYCEQKGEYEWTFTAPTNAAHLEILVYAGIPGHTEGNSVTLKNVRIIQEDHVVNQ